ncbi:ribonuclease H-like domain-containing protein [Tanacetum coccineum]
MGTVRCLINLAEQKHRKFFQMDVNNAFLYRNLNEEVYVVPPPSFFKNEENQVCKLKISLYGLKQAPRQWNHKLYDALVEAYLYSDWAKCPMTRKSVSGNLVFVNRYLVSWKSKQQATLSKSSTEAGNRAMASATCKIMWIVKVFKDFNLDNLVPASLYYDNKSAVQIVADNIK